MCILLNCIPPIYMCIWGDISGIHVPLLPAAPTCIGMTPTWSNVPHASQGFFRVIKKINFLALTERCYLTSSHTIVDVAEVGTAIA